MPCVTTPALLSLHETFDAVIRPRSKDAYGEGYRAHMTLCQDCTGEQIRQAKALVPCLDIGAGFKFSSVELMGRVGPAFGGEWVLIESFILAKMTSVEDWRNDPVIPDPERARALADEAVRMLDESRDENHLDRSYLDRHLDRDA